MTIDPIQLLKNGSLSKSTTSNSSTESRNEAASNTSSTVAVSGGRITGSSAFILDSSLARFIELGARDLAGSALGAYNSQALALQGASSLVSELPAGDALTSRIVGATMNLDLMTKLQGVKSGSTSGSSLDLAS